MTGQVTDAPKAALTLKIIGPDGSSLLIDSILDTGFTDDLTVSPDIIDRLNLPAIDTVECQLADGRTVSMQSCQIVVMWDGVPREILARSADGDSLLGMSMLHGYRLTLDVLPGRAVTIEPIHP